MMRTRMCWGIVALLLTVTFVVTAQAQHPFEDGVAAYERGDYETALQIFISSAEQGSAEGKYYLGLMYGAGWGVPQDYVLAHMWFNLAAVGLPPGNERYVAVRNRDYVQSKMTAAQLVEAQRLTCEWTPIAVEEGDASDQLDLGAPYFIGDSAIRDIGEAAKWLRRAAEQGDASAQLNLGFMYGTGQGVPQNHVRAHMWLNLAAANLRPSEGRNMAARSRDSVEGLMTPDQVAVAQRLAREWKPKFK